MISAGCILFDLDGTLIDPKLGITRSILYALEKMGVESPPPDSLDWCIGPPLHVSMRRLLATTDDDLTQKGVGFFAERFESIGKYEGLVYPEVTSALGVIRSSGARMYLATSKPQPVARDILEHFGLDGYFDGAYGSLGDKAALLANLLEAESIQPGDSLMVGDREHDILAAKKNSMRSVGVTYGYGSIDELKAAQPDYLFDSLADFASSLGQAGAAQRDQRDPPEIERAG